MIESVVSTQHKGPRRDAEGRIRKPGMPEEPRGQRGDDGHSRARGLRNHAARGRRGRPRRQHVQLHRARATGIRAIHSRNGRVQEIRPRAKIDRRGMHGRALPQRNPRADSGSGRRDRHRRSRENPGSLRRETPRGHGYRPGRRRPADVPLSRSHAARAGDAPPHRLHQNQRGLRPSLQLLHHPPASRQIPQPAVRIGGQRSAESGCRGRARNFPDRPGHDLLRRGSRIARRPAYSARASRADRRAPLDSISSTVIRIASRRSCWRRSPRIRASRSISIFPCSTPAAASSRG